jgi:twinkle protein
MTTLDYIRDKGLDHRITAGQVVLKRCPFCGDEGNHFYLDQGEEGPFFCHKCQERGNLFQLKKHLGDIPPKFSSGNGTRKPLSGVSRAFPNKDIGNHRPDPKTANQAFERLLGDTEALSYITEARRISMGAVNHFKLGLQIDKDGSKWLTIPHFVKGELVNIKSRSLPPAEKTFRRVQGCSSVLFNADALEGQEEIYLTEGEIDAITLWDQGVKNVVGVTTGAGSFDPEWIDQLRAVKKIYLCYDPDEPGQKGAREAARRLGYERCFNVCLPEGQDVNEYFRAGNDIFDFQTLVNQAGQFDVAGILSIEKAFDRLREEIKRPEIQAGIMTPWATVNRLMPTGFQSGDLVVLSAPPKVGKTSLALQIASHTSLSDIPTLFYCLEMRPMKLIQKIVQCEIKAEVVGVEELTRAKMRFSGKPLYLGYCYQKPELNGIIQTLKEAVKRYGLKFLVFDHLHFLCRSISNQVQEIGLAVQAFKFLAEEMEIPIILIAQPRKIQADSIMTAMDLKDSSAIFSDCDHLIILHRQRVAGSKETLEGKQPPHDQAYNPITLVRVEASRYNPGGEALLYFHGEWSRFDPIRGENE